VIISLNTREELTAESATLKDGPSPLSFGCKKTTTVPFSFHSSGT
jgi:hypothetical protein